MAGRELEETDIKELVDVCLKAKEKAYAPYSKFRVGCAILTSEGKVFSGTSIPCHPMANAPEQRPIMT